MKYRTVIEVICDASSRDEALHTAGEFLRSNVEFGVEMRSKSMPLRAHKAIKYAGTSLLAITLILVSLIRVPVGGKENNASGIARFGLENTCTVMPSLKTQDKADFKDNWEAKKNEAVLDYLKK